MEVRYAWQHDCTLHNKNIFIGWAYAKLSGGLAGGLSLTVTLLPLSYFAIARDRLGHRRGMCVTMAMLRDGSRFD